jgi:hypothetical protein
LKIFKFGKKFTFFFFFLFSLLFFFFSLCSFSSTSRSSSLLPRGTAGLNQRAARADPRAATARPLYAPSSRTPAPLPHSLPLRRTPMAPSKPNRSCHSSSTTVAATPIPKSFKLNPVSVVRDRKPNHRKKNHIETQSVASTIYRRSLAIVSHQVATFPSNLKSIRHHL